MKDPWKVKGKLVGLCPDLFFRVILLIHNYYFYIMFSYFKPKLTALLYWPLRLYQAATTSF